MTGFKFPDEIDTKDNGVEVEVASTEWPEIDGNDVDISDDAEVEVVDDTPEKDRGRLPLDGPVEDPTDEEMQSYSKVVQKRIQKLTHARHEERRKAEALEREKAELERVAKAMMAENNRLKQYVSTGEQEYAKVVAASAESEVEAAKRKYKEAYEAGDPDALLAAQDALTDAKLKLTNAKNFRPTPVQTTETEVQIPESTPEPRIDDKTLRWQARNQWFGAQGYEDMTSFSLGLHQKLVNSGVDPRSDEYFEQIDARLRKTFPEHFGAQETEKPEPARKPATVVAPAARTTGAKRIRLKQSQIAVATRLGLTPQQYAMELAKLEKQNG